MKNLIKIAEVKNLNVNDLKFLDENREVEERHVKRMCMLICKNGFADTIKVVQFSGSYWVIEGQHRTEALIQLGVEKVPCSIIDWIPSNPEFGIDEDEADDLQKYIIDLNSHNKKWDIYDYVKSWCGKASGSTKVKYEKLRKLMLSKDNKLSNGVLATCYDGVRVGHPALKLGALNFVDENFSDLMVETFSNLVDDYGKSNLPAQVLRGAAVCLLNEEDRYDALRKFSVMVRLFFSTRQNNEPIADGEKSFIFWFEQHVTKNNRI